MNRCKNSFAFDRSNVNVLFAHNVVFGLQIGYTLWTGFCCVDIYCHGDERYFTILMKRDGTLKRFRVWWFLMCIGEFRNLTLSDNSSLILSHGICESFQRGGYTP